MSQCIYKNEDGTICKEDALSKSSFCIFHEKLNKKDDGKCMYLFYNKLREGNGNFEGFILKDVNLKNENITEINTEVDFKNAIFYGNTIFDNVKFDGKTIFNGCKFRGLASFNNSKFLDKSDFEKVEFLNDLNFIRAELSKEVKFENAIFKGRTQFNHSHFRDSIYFGDCIFSKDTFFVETTFSGGASFSESEFLKSVSFFEVIFEKMVTFREVKFNGYTFINNCNFRGEGIFYDTSFSHWTIFNSSQFYNKVFFLKCNFSDVVDFTSTIFHEDAIFSSVFKALAEFSLSSFYRKGDFRFSHLNIVNFINSDLTNVNFDNINLSNCKFSGAMIDRARISNAKWDSDWRKKWRKIVLREEMETICGKYICTHCGTVDVAEGIKCRGCYRAFVNNAKSFDCPLCGHKNNAKTETCKNCSTKFTKKIENRDFQNKTQNYQNIENVYRNIKLSLQNEGNYDDAGEFYFNEMLMKRKGLFHKSKEEKKIIKKINYFFSWLLSHFYSKLCGYGEKPLRVVASWIVIILLFGGFYLITNSIIPSNGNDNLSTFDNFYFSVVTFTTLGFGDIQPSSTILLGKIASMAEALIGAFMMALFVYVFGRKMLR